MDRWGVVGLAAFCVGGLSIWWVWRVLVAAERHLEPRWGAFTDALAARSGTEATRVRSTPVQGTAPHPDHDQTRRVPGDPHDDDTVQDRLDVAAAAGVAGAAGLYQWFNLDEQVLEAFSRYRNEDLENGLDLWRSIADRDGGGGLDLSNPDVLRGLRGHLGEQVAADHLRSAGHTTSLPESGSNPGWDIDVDGGTLINSKITGDAPATLANHFGQYPDVPVLLNADSAGIPESAHLWDGLSHIDVDELSPPGSVLVDESLTSGALIDQLTDAVPAIDPWDSLTDLGDAVPSAGSIIALAMSARREIGLVRGGDTTGARAAKNVAIDGGSRAVGFFAGAKAGGLAGAGIDAATGGTTLGLGFVIGGLLGGIAGNMAAKKAAQHVRRAPLRAAGGALGQCAQDYGAARDSAHADANARLALERERVRLLVAARLLLSRRRLAERAEAAVGAIRESQAVDAAAEFAAARADLQRLARAGDMSTFGGPRLPGWLRRVAACRAVSRWSRRYAPGAGRRLIEPSEVARLWDIVSVSPHGYGAMVAHIDTATRRRRAEVRACEDAVRHEFEALVRTQAVGSAFLSRTHRAEAEAARAALDPLWQKVEAAQETYTRELHAAGLG